MELLFVNLMQNFLIYSSPLHEGEGGGGGGGGEGKVDNYFSEGGIPVCKK